MNHYFLGFDYGKKRIGIAIGQTFTATATPLTTLLVHQQQPEWSKLNALIQEWQPQALVVGTPIHADGSENEMTVAVHSFSEQLAQRYLLPIYLIDERLSSVAAAERPSLISAMNQRKSNYRKSKKNNQSIELDAIAAQIILETWLAEPNQQIFLKFPVVVKCG